MKSAAARLWLRNHVWPRRYPRATDTLRLTTADGVALHAVRLDGPAGCGVTVVIAHGFANWHRHSRIHAFALGLARHANVIVLDLRGHGLSGGTTTVGAYEWRDIAAAAAVVPDGDALVLLGTSMGAGASVTYAGVAAQRGSRRADAVVAVSGPAWWTYRDNARPLTRLVLKAFLRVRAGRVPKTGWIDPVSVVGAIAPASVVVVHDPADWYFGVDHVAAMQAAGDVEVWWRRGGHATDLLDDVLLRDVVSDVIGPLVSGGRSPAGR